MEAAWKETVWRQFGATIETLEGVMSACPEALWSDRVQRPEFWYLVYHTLFFLDFYLSQPTERFAPPPPFGLEELDPAGVLPERPYTKAELGTYLEHCHRKCRERIAALTETEARRRYVLFSGTEIEIGELLLYNLRHVQHHSAQLNLILRQQTDTATGWVSRAKEGLGAR